MTIEKSVLVPLDPEQTFALLTEPERIRRWMGVSARIDLRAGGDFYWTVVPGSIAEGEFTEIEPGKRLAFTWGWVGNDAVGPGSSVVTITLEPADGGTTVRLVHEGLSDEEGTGHLDGWTHYLERLVTAATSGDAGPDLWEATASVVYDPLNAAEASLAVCQLTLRDLSVADRRAQTPCAKYDVDALVEHLMGSLVSLGGASGAAIGDDKNAAPEVRVAEAGQQAIEGWRRRGLEGTVALGGGDIPADLAVRIVIMELLVHAWDFARATGRELPANDALATYALEMAQGVIAPSMRDGDNFGDDLSIGLDADAITRLAAYTGRAA